MIAHRKLGSLLLLSAVAAACGTDGTTPSCEDYPLPYDIRVPARRSEVWEDLSGPAADPSYCTIVPAGYAPSNGGNASRAGAGGSTGMDAGSGGDGGVGAGSGGDGAGGSP